MSQHFGTLCTKGLSCYEHILCTYLFKYPLKTETFVFLLNSGGYRKNSDVNWLLSYF